MISYDAIKSGEAMVPVAKPDTNSIPSLIDRATKRLAEAKSSAEVLEAKAAAELALHYAKVTKAANESHADCLRIITRAEIRMAGEIDRAQEAGEVAKPGRKQNVPASDNKATMAELGISRQRVNEWRKVAEAGEEKVEEAISEALAEGRAPTKADIHRAAGIVKDRPKSDEDKQFTDLMEAWNAAGQGARERFLAETNLDFIAAPVVAAEATGNDLREPVAAEQGQIIREGDAPRETGRFCGDASSPDTEFKSTAAPTVEPEAVPSPPTVSGNHLYPDPHTPGAATAGPANQAPQTPAQNGDVDSHIVGQGGHRPVVHLGHAVQEDASAAQTGNEAGSVSGATVTNSKPDCLDPEHCSVPFTSALCARCNDARMKRRSAE